MGRGMVVGWGSTVKGIDRVSFNRFVLSGTRGLSKAFMWVDAGAAERALGAPRGSTVKGYRSGVTHSLSHTTGVRSIRARGKCRRLAGGRPGRPHSQGRLSHVSRRSGRALGRLDGAARSRARSAASPRRRRARAEAAVAAPRQASHRRSAGEAEIGEPSPPLRAVDAPQRAAGAPRQHPRGRASSSSGPPEPRRDLDEQRHARFVVDLGQRERQVERTDLRRLRPRRPAQARATAGGARGGR